MTKFDFQTDPDVANEKRIEDKAEAYMGIVQAIHYARTNNYLLELTEIAKAIKEGIGEDIERLAGLLYVISTDKGTKLVNEQEKNVNEILQTM